MKRWTVKLCIEAVRRYSEACEATGEVPCLNGYKAWHAAHGGTPSAGTVTNALGSWNAARTLAAREGEDVHVRPPGHPGEPKSLTECLDAVARYERYCNEADRPPTRDGYLEWAHQQDPPVPSVSPIERFGSWNDMRRRAAKEAGIDPETLRFNRPGRQPHTR